MLFRTLMDLLSDKKASMATQVVIFSVMLFGMSGVVLDFGRVYNEHSRMQAFTDQAALAAAGELNGQPGAIQRAINAVFNADGSAMISKGTSFSADAGEGDLFNVSHLYFLNEMSDETGRQYNLGDDLENYVFVASKDGLRQGAGGMSIDVASTQARYVVAVAEERSVLNSLMSLVNASGRNNIADSQKVRTISAAKHQKVTCGDVSNLVICNPWEADPGASMQSVLGNPANVGIQFNNVATGDLSAVTQAGSNTLARRLELQGTAAVRNICENNATLPGYSGGMSQAEEDLTRAICYLAAAARSGQNDFCLPPEIPIAAASAEEVTTALSTAFDMWDEPISAVLDWDRDASGYHSQEVDRDGALLYNPGSAHPLRDMSSLFQPDVNIMKGRVRNEAPYSTNRATRPASSRLNYPMIADVTIDAYEDRIASCIRPDNGLNGTNCLPDSQGDDIPYISQPSNYANVWEYYGDFHRLHQSGGYYHTTFLPDQDQFPTMASIIAEEVEQWSHHNQNGILGLPIYDIDYGYEFQKGDPLPLSREDGSLFTSLSEEPAFPQTELRRCRDDVGALEPARGWVGASDVPVNPHCRADLPTDAGGNEIDDPARAPDPENIAAFRSPDSEREYSNYTYNPAYNPIATNDRRMIDITIVNCGSTTVNAAGQTMAEVVGIAQMHLLVPPRVTCPGGGEDCANNQITQSDIFMEFVEVKDDGEQSFAVLVR